MTIYNGDCLAVLDALPEQSVHCCVTSPPYFGLRDYGTARWEGGDDACSHQRSNFRQDHSGNETVGRGSQQGAAARATPFRNVCGKCGAVRIDPQIGLESTVQEYVVKLVEVFRKVWRVLADDGTLWLNLGDSYNAYNGGAGPSSREHNGRRDQARPKLQRGHGLLDNSLKPKDLIGVPWRVAFALQDDGWTLRSDIIWAKRNTTPESVKDRPTKAHEYIFLLSKKARYYYCADAIREPLTQDKPAGNKRGFNRGRINETSGWAINPNPARSLPENGRNKRSVWTMATKPLKAAHFATFPPKLIEPCILAGCPEGSTVLDPFAGAGTTGLVARQWGRNFLGIEINETYCQLIRERLAQSYLTFTKEPEESNGGCP